MHVMVDYSTVQHVHMVCATAVVPERMLVLVLSTHIGAVHTHESKTIKLLLYL